MPAFVFFLKTVNLFRTMVARFYTPLGFLLLPLDPPLILVFYAWPFDFGVTRVAVRF